MLLLHQGCLRLVKDRTVTKPDDIVTNDPFVLSLIFSGSAPHERRQSFTGFIGGFGSTTQDCSTAMVYSLVNGQLFANTSSGALQFGTNTSTTSKAFIPTPYPNTIVTTFSVDANSVLLWTNSTFYNGGARFCVTSDSAIYAVFTLGGEPSGCQFINLNLVRGRVFGRLPTSRCLLIAAVSSCLANGVITGPSGIAGEH